jgi:uncharacterized protein YutE (UPF0331/DUF86 family)
MGIATPSDYYHSFTELAPAGLITPSLAEQLAPASGLRNRLVREYDVIDDEIVLPSVRDALRPFPPYLAAIERCLTRQGF